MGTGTRVRVRNRYQSLHHWNRLYKYTYRPTEDQDHRLSGQLRVHEANTKPVGNRRYCSNEQASRNMGNQPRGKMAVRRKKGRKEEMGRRATEEKSVLKPQNGHGRLSGN